MRFSSALGGTGIGTVAAAVTLLLGFGLDGARRQVPTDDPRAQLVRELAGEGVRLDLERGLCAIDATVLARYEPLEYLLVGEMGQTHESLLGTDVRASVLNTALLLLGAEPGTNARWVELDEGAGEGVGNDGLGGPPPERSADGDDPPRRAPRYRIEPPTGGGFYLYAAWREGDELYLHRVEDLVANVERRRSLRRHRFVYLGSRMVRPKPNAEEVFAADLEQNLINLAFFRAGHTLLTTAVESASSEDIWFANHWLVPEAGAGVRLVFSRERLPARVDSTGVWEELPRVVEEE